VDSVATKAGESGARIGDTEIWLDACRRMVEGHRAIFDEVSGIAARTEYEGVGEGGDRTLVIDRRCEDVAFAELERLHGAGSPDFVAISEERGEVAFGDPGAPVRVVIDPIDGSLNARRLIPAHSLSVAVASGSSMGDVELGFVHDFGAEEEFTAIRGEGARVGGEPLVVERPFEGLEVVSLESANPETITPVIAALAGRVWRIRAPGSIAISLAYVGAGRFDGMLTARRTRSVDAAAGQLIAREAGALVRFGELGLGDAPLDLAARYELAAALDQDGLETLLEVQRQAVV
jgi:myo-inositol-1(or 4)-monophosphatase